MPGPKPKIWTWAEFLASLDRIEGHLVWQGPVDREGYGYTNHGGARWRAHTLAYHLGKGPVAFGMLARNTCGVRLCCDPEHYTVVKRGQFLRDLRDEGIAPDILDVAWRGGRGKRRVREEETPYNAGEISEESAERHELGASFQDREG